MVLILILSAGLAGGQVQICVCAASPEFVGSGNREPIYIYGDCGFTRQNGVVSGSGTCADPYIIEGWRIDGPRADYGIYIDHTRAHFIIRDCVITSSRIAGIYMNSVCNGVVEDVEITLSDTAIYFLNSDWNVVRRSTISDCKIGVEMAAFSDCNVVAGNSFIDNGHHALDPMRENRWCEGGRGNYWSDFVGCDRNGDGIFDAPNYRYGDPCPLVEPPPEPTPVVPLPVMPVTPPVVVTPQPEEQPAIVEPVEPTEIVPPQETVEQQTPSQPVGSTEIQTPSETPAPESPQTPSETIESPTAEDVSATQTPSVTPETGAVQTPTLTTAEGQVQTPPVVPEGEEDQTPSSTPEPSTALPIPIVDLQTPPAVPEPVVEGPRDEDGEPELDEDSGPSEEVQSPSENAS